MKAEPPTPPPTPAPAAPAPRKAPSPQAAKPSTLDESTRRAAEHLKALEARGRAHPPGEQPQAVAPKGPEAQELAQRYEALLSLPGTPEQRKPEILLRLAELAYREEEASLRGAYESGAGPRSAALRYPKAIGHYRRLVDGYGASPQALTALYNLGYLYAEEGKSALSAWAYEQVLQRDPQTPYSDEIHMRLGEAAFDGDDIQAAIPHYRAVVAHGNREYADKALYKLGWSFYNLDDYEKAVDAFSKVMDREDGGSEDLRRETLQILARCFVEWGGVRGIGDYLAAHPRGAGYGDRLYRAVGELYAGASNYKEAVRAHSAGIEAFPRSAECVAMEKGILSSLLTLRDLEGATVRRESWAQRYGPGSEWEKGKSDALVKEARALVEDGLRAAALHRHAEAQRNRSGLDRALALYQRYFEVFPDDTEDGYELSYSYAQALKEAGRLREAAARYKAVATQAKHSARREEASYRRVEVLQALLEKDPAAFEDLVDAREQYAALNPSSTLVPQVLFGEADLLFGAERFARARAVYQRVAALGGTDPLRLDALERVARCHFREGNYVDAEAAARRALQAPLPPESADRARQLVSFSIFKQAEEREGAGDRAAANGHFFRVAEEFPNEEVAQVALSRSAENLKILGKGEEAAEVYGRISGRYRGSPYAKQALASAAEILSSLGQWKRAAVSFEELHGAENDPTQAAQALFRAGLAFEKAGELGETARVFDAFASRYPGDGRRTQAHFRAGEALRAQGRGEEAKAWYQKAWDGSAAGDEQVYRARAALALGDLALEAFRKTELKGDLEEALSRKEALQEEALARLADAASLPYADTLTAALYRAGRVFEEMKEALLASERPAELTPEEKEQYDFLLEEKAGPLEERAIEYYKKGFAAARRAGVYTEWVERMMGRLEALVPWAYQRKEEPAAAWSLPGLSGASATVGGKR